ncbi:hypothetical protein ACU5EH_06295 [Aliivibrio salmonicida]|uniref:hypothetical protein n=1 Tax=Aliivibrio salmonicida TaxID=40269 RepID=UPI00406CF64D
MKEFQFFTNDKTFTYIDIKSSTYEDEKEQILKQGFVVCGEIIKAHTIEDAIELHKNSSGDRMKEYTMIGVIAGLFAGF